MTKGMLGSHIILDLWGLPRNLLDDASELGELLAEAAGQGGAHVVELCFHHFQPQGVTGVLILAESHLALHSWPELGYAAVDVFTCGSPEVAESVADAVVALFKPADHQRRRLERGTIRQRLAC